MTDEFEQYGPTVRQVISWLQSHRQDATVLLGTDYKWGAYCSVDGDMWFFGLA